MTHYGNKLNTSALTETRTEENEGADTGAMPISKSQFCQQPPRFEPTAPAFCADRKEIWTRLSR